MNDDTREQYALEVFERLHTHYDILSNLKCKLAPTKEYLTRFSPDGILTNKPAEIESQKLSSVNSYIESLTRVVHWLEKIIDTFAERSDWSREKVTNCDIRLLSEFVQKSHDWMTTPDTIASRVPFLRCLLIDVTDVLYEVKINRSLRREFLRASMMFLRCICFDDLAHVEEIIDGMYQETEALSKYYKSKCDRSSEMSVVSVKHLLDQACREQLGVASRRNIRFASMVGDTSTMVEVNVQDVKLALSNILNNAVKYSNNRDFENPWIYIRCKRHRGVVHIEIENWGLRIPQDEIDSGVLFRPTYKGALARKMSTEGFGIGLAMAHNIIAKHGGKISISSIPDTKIKDENHNIMKYLTTFTVSIPCK